MFDLSFLTGDLIFTLIFAAILVGLVVFLAVSVRRARKNPDGAEESVSEATEDLDGGREDDRREDDRREDDRRKDDRREDDGTDEEADGSWTPPEPEGFPARIVDMRVVTGNVGSHKRPKTGFSFLVTFLTDDGKRTEYPVPEELYVTLDVDQTGTLVILNGGFFDFGSGEEYDPAAVEAFEEAFGTAEEAE